MVFMPHWPKPLNFKPINYNLGSMRHLLEVLGNPQDHLPPTIHIAGTNGKGSTNAYIRSICKAAGLKYHAYTSPHLIDFNERIVLSNEKISDEYLFELCETVRLEAEKANLQPTFFEGTTAVAFLAFSHKDADLLILETGIGGRLDATNLVQKPLMSIITPISFDHMDILGYRLSDIAYEKAGIIKPDVPCVISSQVPEVEEVLLEKAHEQNAPFISYGRDFGVHKTQDSFEFMSKYLNCKLPMPTLKGDHQILNAATTIAALSFGQNLFKFTKDHFEEGLRNVYWPARLMQVNQCHKFLIQSPSADVWVDGAHNHHGAKVLAKWIRDELSGKISLIIGMTKNRDANLFLCEFEGMFEAIYTVPVESEPLSYSGETLAQLAAKFNPIPCKSLEEALSRVKADQLIITGSLFLAVDVFKLVGINI